MVPYLKSLLGSRLFHSIDAESSLPFVRGSSVGGVCQLQCVNRGFRVRLVVYRVPVVDSLHFVRLSASQRFSLQGKVSMTLDCKTYIQK
jgi:hypothetical protein